MTDDATDPDPGLPRQSAQADHGHRRQAGPDTPVSSTSRGRTQASTTIAVMTFSTTSSGRPRRRPPTAGTWTQSTPTLGAHAVARQDSGGFPRTPLWPPKPGGRGCARPIRASDSACASCHSRRRRALRARRASGERQRRTRSARPDRIRGSSSRSGPSVKANASQARSRPLERQRAQQPCCCETPLNGGHRRESGRGAADPCGFPGQATLPAVVNDITSVVRGTSYRLRMPVKVREAIKRLEAAGWELSRTRGRSRRRRRRCRSRGRPRGWFRDRGRRAGRWT